MSFGRTILNSHFEWYIYILGPSHDDVGIQIRLRRPELKLIDDTDMYGSGLSYWPIVALTRLVLLPPRLLALHLKYKYVVRDVVKYDNTSTNTNEDACEHRNTNEADSYNHIYDVMILFIP